MLKYIVLILLSFFINISPITAGQGCCSWHNGESNRCDGQHIICNDGWVSSCLCENTNNDYTYDYQYKTEEEMLLDQPIVQFLIFIGTLIIAIIADNYETKNNNLK